MALTLRINLPWERSYAQALLIFTLLALLVKMPVFYAFRLYVRYWRYASMDELTAIALAVGISSVLVTALTYLGQGLNFLGGEGLPRSLAEDGRLTTDDCSRPPSSVPRPPSSVGVQRAGRRILAGAHFGQDAAQARPDRRGGGCRRDACPEPKP